MTTQVFPFESAMPEAELQQEFERLFGEIEQMIDCTKISQQQAAEPVEHWAYLPSDHDVEQVGNFC